MWSSLALTRHLKSFVFRLRRHIIPDGLVMAMCVAVSRHP
jgi:hypothetical protein